MTMESDLVTVLHTCCARVFPDFAPFATQRPYVTYQHIGGPALRFTENTPADQRHTLVQINTWATTRAAALLLARQIEDALCAASSFTATVQNEPTGQAENTDPPLYGCIQDFAILAPR